MYAPLSVVTHHEGVSSGTDAASGVKKHQAMNAPLFKAKWGGRSMHSHVWDLRPTWLPITEVSAGVSSS